MHIESLYACVWIVTDSSHGLHHPTSNINAINDNAFAFEVNKLIEYVQVIQMQVMSRSPQLRHGDDCGSNEKVNSKNDANITLLG